MPNFDEVDPASVDELVTWYGAEVGTEELVKPNDGVVEILLDTVVATLDVEFG